jgi:putative SOS response-associated peptidase YedK
MCGRYTHNLTWEQIVSLYRLTLPEDPPEGVTANFNVAPTTVMPIIRPAGNGRELVMAGWGLVPFWLKPGQLDQQPYSTINARADRIQTAPTYREPFQRRRCIVPATGWYEWMKITANTKKPYHFRPQAEPFAFAGVYDVWKGDGKSAITSFAIVTTEAAPSTARYHDRMPVILTEDRFDDWMRRPPEIAAQMMVPYGGAIEIWEVDNAVGNVRNNRPELMERAALL